MSTIGFGQYEQHLADQNAKVFEEHRKNFKPYMACHNTMRLLSVEYKPTAKGKPRWIGQVDAINAPHVLPITLWQEDIDFLNGVLALNITTEPITFEEQPVVITSHCDPKWGLNRIDSVVKGGIISKTDVNWQTKAIVLVEPEPIATPVAVAVPAVKLLPAPKTEPQFCVGQVAHWINPVRGFTTETYIITKVIQLDSVWYALKHPYLDIEIKAKAENIHLYEAPVKAKAAA